MRICLIAEGCYPYVAGGVSSWVQMLIQGMPEHEFILYTIGATQDQRGRFQYDLPPNLVEVHENFLDEYVDRKARHRATYHLKPQERQALVDLITKNRTDWDRLFAMFGQGGPYQANEFLASDAFLDIVMEACADTYSLTPFNEVFWTIRSMLLPVLNILRCPVPKADVFHTVSTGYAGILGALFQYQTGKPYIVTEHGIYSREREEEILKAKWVDVYFKQTWINFFLGMAAAAYSHADRIISLFHHARELQLEYGAAPEKCSVIPNGIQMGRFQGIPPIRLDPHPLRLGAVIRVVPIKDLKTMIYAFALVRQRQPEAELYMIGPTDEDPEYFAECQELIQGLGVEGVSFVGRVDVAQWYGKLDLVLLSSVSEGQPFVVLEAMASRRPLVTTDVGSCRELLEGNGDGLGPAGAVVPVMSPNEMARAILRLGRDLPALRQMGENGWRRVDRFYQEEDFLTAYRKLYQEVRGHGWRRV